MGNRNCKYCVNVLPFIFIVIYNKNIHDNLLSKIVMFMLFMLMIIFYVLYFIYLYFQEEKSPEIKGNRNFRYQKYASQDRFLCERSARNMRIGSSKYAKKVPFLCEMSYTYMREKCQFYAKKTLMPVVDIRTSRKSRQI